MLEIFGLILVIMIGLIGKEYMDKIDNFIEKNLEED